MSAIQDPQLASHREVVETVDGEIPHGRRAGHRADRRHRRRRPVGPPHWLANVEGARRQPAMVRRQPGMARRLVRAASPVYGGRLGLESMPQYHQVGHVGRSTSVQHRRYSQVGTRRALIQPHRSEPDSGRSSTSTLAWVGSPLRVRCLRGRLAVGDPSSQLRPLIEWHSQRVELHAGNARVHELVSDIVADDPLAVFRRTEEGWGRL